MKIQLWKSLLIALLASAVAANEEDYYKILEVPRSASKSDIKKAFRTLSRKYHPDVNKAADASERFSKISEAYDVLTDDTKRQKYDRFGKEGLKETNRGGGGFGGDPFDFFFGGGSRDFGGQEEEQKGDPLVIKISASLEDIYNGREISMAITKKSICSHCRGSGAEDPDDVAKCDACEGRGILIRRVQVAPGFVQQVQSVCPKCQGKGKVVKSTCHVCGGKKLMDDYDTFKVTIEKGVPNKHRVTIYNMGGDYIDKLSSDVIFEISEQPHNFYKRIDEINLRVELKITLREALLGFSKKLKHLDGHYVLVEKNGVTQPNEVKIIRGEGMPKHDYQTSRGDLFVIFKVEVPESYTQNQKDLWKKFFDA